MYVQAHRNVRLGTAARGGAPWPRGALRVLTYLPDVQIFCWREYLQTTRTYSTFLSAHLSSSTESSANNK